MIAHILVEVILADCSQKLPIRQNKFPAKISGHTVLDSRTNIRLFGYSFVALCAVLLVVSVEVSGITALTVTCSQPIVALCVAKCHIPLSVWLGDVIQVGHVTSTPFLCCTLHQLP